MHYLPPRTEPSAQRMKVALFHNSGAGSGAARSGRLVRQFASRGYDVLYVETNKNGWEAALRDPIDRAIVAGGDGTVGRLVPWLAGRGIPFCILPLGTANNCAKTLGQMHTVESVVANLHLAPIKKLDLGILTSPVGHRIFIESVGIGLLAKLMGDMRVREKKKKSKSRLTAEERIADALKQLQLLSKAAPGAECDLLLDDERVAGELLLLEVANMGLIGPNLELVSSVDPSDGFFDVLWIRADRRTEWRNYLSLLRRGVKSAPPVNKSRCRQALFRCADAPTHIDGEVFLTMATPITISVQSGALDLVDFGGLT
jgi:diacylglycerol kinase (ATP)